ncbi:hypothetical protein SFRURICE_014479, partial [Spodoptera frugiperda]
MLSKRAKFNDSLEHYYYEKINLLNRCEIYGRRAVDCLLYGIEDRSLRLGAKAAKCQEPEQVLTYFQSIKQNLREPDNEAVKRGITWTASNLPTMRGIGESIVIPVGVSNVIIEIQGIMEEVNAYIVDDRVIKYSVLIGHSFTEKPGIVITKTTHSLIFTRDQSVKLELNLKTDILIPPKEMYLLPCFSTNKYSGMVHVSGSLRGTPQNEYYLMPGDYDMENGEVRILVQSFSDSA